eukprot:538492_1
MESVVSFYCFVLVSIPFRIIAALIQFVVFIVIGISLSIVCCYHYCFAICWTDNEDFRDSMCDVEDMNIPLLSSIYVYVGKLKYNANKSRNKIETDTRIDKPKDLRDDYVKEIKQNYLHSKKDIARFEEPRKNNTPFIIPNCGSIFRGFGKVILHG